MAETNKLAELDKKRWRITMQALATLAREQAEMEDHDNLRDTIHLIHQHAFDQDAYK